MKQVMADVGKKMNCYVVQQGDKKRMGGEYFNIDAFFFDLAEFEVHDDYDYDPFVLPRAIVEHENSSNFRQISYCLWKLLCIRSPIMALVCYQSGSKRIASLKDHLENIIWKGGLMKGNPGDLLILIGNEGAPSLPWDKYFHAFEWRNDRLERIEEAIY